MNMEKAKDIRRTDMVPSVKSILALDAVRARQYKAVSVVASLEFTPLQQSTSPFPRTVPWSPANTEVSHDKKHTSEGAAHDSLCDFGPWSICVRAESTPLARITLDSDKVNIS